MNIKEEKINNKTHPKHHHHDLDLKLSSKEEMVKASKKLSLTFLLNIIITLSEILGGIFSGSIALLSDAFHNLNDAFSQLIALIALKLSFKKKNLKYTFGYKRAQILAAILNSSLIIAISVYLIYEAIKRFSNPHEIKTGIMLIVASIGLVANLFSVLLLEKHTHNNMNIKASYLHLLGDTISSVGVVLGGILIKFFNLNFIDPLITILIALYILKEGFSIIKETTRILLQGTPQNIDINNIKNEIEKIEKVKNIHHIHIWNLDENTIMFEAHIEVENMLLCDTDHIYKNIKEILSNKFNISHITLQFETDRCKDKNPIVN